MNSALPNIKVAVVDMHYSGNSLGFTVNTKYFGHWRRFCFQAKKEKIDLVNWKTTVSFAGQLMETESVSEMQ
jgi:hypothetical protein